MLCAICTSSKYGGVFSRGITLSEQMFVALPIVSQAASTRMRFWSLYIFLVEYAREIVTASGRPCETERKKMKKEEKVNIMFFCEETR